MGGWLWKEKVTPGPEEERWGIGEWWEWQVYMLKGQEVGKHRDGWD